MTPGWFVTERPADCIWKDDRFRGRGLGYLVFDELFAAGLSTVSAIEAAFRSGTVPLSDTVRCAVRDALYGGEQLSLL